MANFVQQEGLDGVDFDWEVSNGISFMLTVSYG